MKKIMLSLVLLAMLGEVKAQEQIVVSPGAPFLMINPDVRSAGMGETGVAGTKGVWSMYFNPAAYAQAEGKGGVAFSYTPWMRNFTDGQNLYALAGYYRIDEKSAVAMTARFFTAGDYPLVSGEGDELATASAHNFAIDAAYARQFGKFSVALALRLINAVTQDKTAGEDYRWEFDPSYAFAVDLGVLYTDHFQLNGEKGNWQVGLSLTNWGSRLKNKGQIHNPGIPVIDYEYKDYLPAMIRLGGNADLPFCRDHGLSVALDFSKLLVENSTGGAKDNSALSNIFGAFGNDKFLESVVWSVGAEYNWKHTVMGRLGYFHESETYGERQYFTIGARGCYRGFTLDAAYLMPAGESDASYKNTWRIGVGYVF